MTARDRPAGSPVAAAVRSAPVVSPSVAVTVTAGESASLYWTLTPSGAVLVTAGADRIVKSASLTSKKTFPTASILIRAFPVATFGSVTVAEPVLAVCSASTYGKVSPPSADSEIFTCAAFTGATSVPATSHVTVWAEPPSRTAAAPCEVTRNGPASGASTTATSPLPMPPPPSRPSRAVSLKCRVRSPAMPTQSRVGRNSE